MAAFDIESIVDTNFRAAADDGSALLAVLGLDRILRRRLRITKGDVQLAGGLARNVASRCSAILARDGFLPVRLDMRNQDFTTFRDLVAEGLDETRLAEQLAAIASDDLKLSFATLINTALSTLQARLPKVPVRSKPSEFIAASFVRAWRTISNPLSVLGDLEMGCLSRDQVQVLKSIYPALYSMFCEAMYAAVIEKSTDPEYIVPYPKLKQISVLFQQPLVPEDLRGLLTKSFDQPEAADESRPGGAPKLDQQTATDLQKREYSLG